MLFDFIFLSNLLPESFSYPQKEGEKETGVVAGYVIEEVNSIFFNFFFDPSFYKKEQRFCLALQSQIFNQNPGNTLEFFSESLAPLLFNSSYFTVNGNPVIAIIDSADHDPGKLQVALEILENVFRYLGYDDFNYCFLNGSTGRVTNTNMAIDVTIYDPKSNELDVKAWYYNFLEECGISRRLIFLFQPASVAATDICSQLMNAESGFREKHPHVFSLLEDGVDFERRFEQYEISIKGLQKEVESRDAYISNLNIPETTLKRLSDFYHNEYEILPLWYKRFGHLIKVFMGKRSFRSLYDDKVKKYND
jgi:hypothetical protein